MGFKKGKLKTGGIKKGQTHPGSKKNMKEIVQKFLDDNPTVFQDIYDKLTKGKNKSPWKAGMFILKGMEFGFGKIAPIDPKTGEAVQAQVHVYLPEKK